MPDLYAKLPPSFIPEKAMRPTVYKSLSKIVGRVTGESTQSDSYIITFHRMLRLAGGISPGMPPEWSTTYYLQPEEVLLNYPDCAPSQEKNEIYVRLRRLENSSYTFLEFLRKVNRPYWVYIMCRWNGRANTNMSPSAVGSTFHTDITYGCLTIDEKKSFSKNGKRRHSAMLTMLHEFSHFIHVGGNEDKIFAAITDSHDANFRDILNELHEYATAPPPSGLGWKLLMDPNSFDYKNGENTRCPRCIISTQS